MGTRTLTKVITLENDETTLRGFGDALEDALDAACQDIESRGGEIVGPVSITPATASLTDYPSGTYRSTTTTETGVVAVITYRMPFEPQGT